MGRVDGHAVDGRLAMIRAADDAETISRRLAELRAERVANLLCRCQRSADGTTLDTTECALHAPGAEAMPEYACGLHLWADRVLP